MSHHIPWCGCDPNHLPTHARGKVAGCKFNQDPREVLVRDTEQFLQEHSRMISGTILGSDAIALLRRWIDLDG